MEPIDLSMVTTAALVIELQNRGADKEVPMTHDGVVDLDIVGPCTVIIIEEGNI